MEPNDFYRMYQILEVESIEETERLRQFNYWTKRVVERIEYLKPLIEELKLKKIDLSTLSKELHQEWLDLIEVRKFYNI